MNEINCTPETRNLRLKNLKKAFHQRNAFFYDRFLISARQKFPESLPLSVTFQKTAGFPS
jgi:hypothetical protein